MKLKARQFKAHCALAGFTQREVSKQLGYSSTWIYGARKHWWQVSEQKAKEMARLLGCNVSDIFETCEKGGES